MASVFASRDMREIGIEAAGERIGDGLRAHPVGDRVAEHDVEVVAGRGVGRRRAAHAHPERGRDGGDSDADAPHWSAAVLHARRRYCKDGALAAQ